MRWLQLQIQYQYSKSVNNNHGGDIVLNWAQKLGFNRLDQNKIVTYTDGHIIKHFKDPDNTQSKWVFWRTGGSVYLSPHNNEVLCILIAEKVNRSNLMLAICFFLFWFYFLLPPLCSPLFCHCLVGAFISSCRIQVVSIYESWLKPRCFN